MCEVLSSRRIGEDEDTGLQVFGTAEVTIWGFINSFPRI